ncbi:MAG: DNA internalization-related competence protein ComEC/Rec2 [Burkholderiales bacterium]|nr:DNA internalization-related competence protein ComEC/Rec2 [Burkholderiales bacterium]
MRAAIIAFVIGVALLQQQSSLLRLPLLTGMALFAAVLYYGFGQRTGAIRYRYLCVGVRCLCSAAAGFIWASAMAHWYLHESLPAVWENRDITVIGVVDSLPHQFEQGVRFNFAIEHVLRDSATGDAPAIPSRVALSWYGNARGNRQTVAEIHPGERWQFTVRLKRPNGSANPDGFDYEVWLLDQRLRATGAVRNETAASLQNRRLDTFVWSANNCIQRARETLRTRILAALPEHPYAGVLVALVVGDQREINQSDWTVFNRAGIGHLISISGLHITMIAGLFAAGVFYLWRHSFFIGDALPLRLPAQKAAVIAGALAALLYVALAGFGVPAQRTMYMLLVVAVAVWSGRIANFSLVLCLALGAVVFLDPWAVLWPGFWLSFSAVALIVYATGGRVDVAQDTESRPAQAWRANVLQTLKNASATQYAVTIGLVPLTMLLFGQVSVISPLANAVAIPLVSLVVTPLALVGSILPSPLSVWVLQFAHTCVALLAQLLSALSSFSFAVWRAPLPSFGVFTLAMGGTFWLMAPRGWPLRYLGWFCWLPLLLQTPQHPPERTLTVTALDVGQGMALLLETSQHRLLYDTGPAYSPESDSGSRVIVPYLNARGIHHLDTVVVSHNDSDHSGGALSVMRQIPVDVLLSSLSLESPIVSGAPVHRRCMAGQHWEWDGVQFDILQPVGASYDSVKWKPNARSCVLRVATAKYVMLLPGDIEAVQEDEMIHSLGDRLHADVLLAPHHGSGTSSTPAFLQAVHPTLAVFQVGYLNRYHHPKAEVFQRYADFGVKRLRTDETGAITLQFGTSLQFSEFRQQHARYWYRK